jgi:hypothetical protein
LYPRAIVSSVQPGNALAEDFVLDSDPRRVPALKRAHAGWRVIPFRKCDRHIAIGSLGRLRRKSAPLGMFMQLSRRSDLRLLDLQYGDTAAERAAFAAAGGRLLRLEDLDLFHDVDGVLAAIEACELVITTSNVTAHFAGALGKPAWLVYPGANAPFYYWTPGEDGRCLSYPSVRIVSLDSWEAFQTGMQSLHI